jgi:hypothetical protein
VIESRGHRSSSAIQEVEWSWGEGGDGARRRSMPHGSMVERHGRLAFGAWDRGPGKQIGRGCRCNEIGRCPFEPVGRAVDSATNPQVDKSTISREKPPRRREARVDSTTWRYVDKSIQLPLETGLERGAKESWTSCPVPLSQRTGARRKLLRARTTIAPGRPDPDRRREPKLLGDDLGRRRRKGGATRLIVALRLDFNLIVEGLDSLPPDVPRFPAPWI